MSNGASAAVVAIVATVGAVGFSGLVLHVLGLLSDVLRQAKKLGIAPTNENGVTHRSVTMFEAVGSVAESFAIAVAKGANLTDALVSACGNPNKVLDESLAALEQDLSRFSFVDALDRFATRLDDPLVDLFSAHLIQMRRLGAKQLNQASGRLAEQFGAELVSEARIAQTRDQFRVACVRVGSLILVVCVLCVLVIPEVKSVYLGSPVGLAKLMSVLSLIGVAIIAAKRASWVRYHQRFRLRRL